MVARITSTIGKHERDFFDLLAAKWDAEIGPMPVCGLSPWAAVEQTPQPYVVAVVYPDPPPFEQLCLTEHVSSIRVRHDGDVVTITEIRE